LLAGNGLGLWFRCDKSARIFVLEIRFKVTECLSDLYQT